MNDSDEMKKLVEALHAGGYDAKPTALKNGCEGLVLVDIGPIIEKTLDDVASGESLKHINLSKPKQEQCVVCKQNVYMVTDGTGDIYCTRHSKEFNEQFCPSVKFCDTCKNSGNHPHSHFHDLKKCYCGSYRPCDDCGGRP